MKRRGARSMQSKLIFLDVDGTLTPPGGYEPPESAVRAIKRAQENGHKVFLCSGRNYYMLEPLLKYGFDGGIASCGGYVFAGDEVLLDGPMAEEQKDRLMSLLAESGVSVELEARDASFSDDIALRYLEGDRRRNDELERMIRAVWIDLGPRPMEEYDGSPIYKIVFVCSDTDQLVDAEAELGEEFSFIIHDFSEPDCKFGELVNRKYDKGSGVRLIAESLGYDIADTIGFGDSMIDIEMIETVGTSVCMDNGSPRLKKLSDMTCPSVYEDGLEWAFRRLGII